jgi:hypothetical protein
MLNARRMADGGWRDYGSLAFTRMSPRVARMVMLGRRH